MSVASVDTPAVRGRAARLASPRSGHAVFEPASDRRYPVDLLEERDHAALADAVRAGMVAAETGV